MISEKFSTNSDMKENFQTILFTHLCVKTKKYMLFTALTVLREHPWQGGKSGSWIAGSSVSRDPQWILRIPGIPRIANGSPYRERILWIFCIANESSVSWMSVLYLHSIIGISFDDYLFLLYTKYLYYTVQCASLGLSITGLKVKGRIRL